MALYNGMRKVNCVRVACEKVVLRANYLAKIAVIYFVSDYLPVMGPGPCYWMIPILSSE